MIRDATVDDAEGILAIYNPIVRDTSISFETEPVSEPAMRYRIRAVCDGGFPYLVDERDGGVAGYAYGSPHRKRAAYRFSCESSIFVHPAYRRRGVARGLYTALLERLRAGGFHRVWAGITLPNPASVGFHRVFEFEPVGIYEEVGFKDGVWHDVIWMGRRL